ncbi:MAG: methyltransferase [Candidatus Scalindua sp.]
MNGRDIKEICIGNWKAEAMFTANRMRIFDCLDSGLRSAEDIAGKLDVDAGFLERLLNVLVSLGLLSKEDDSFKNSETADNFFVKGKETYMGNLVAHFDSMKGKWSRLEECIKKGESLISDIPEDQRAGKLKDFMLAMRDNSTLSIPPILNILDLSECENLLDLACGPGSYSVAFAGRYETLKITLFDIPEVIEIAKQSFDDGLRKRIGFIGGDITRDELGDSLYDAAFVSNLIHMYDPGVIRKIFKKVARALRRDGRIIIHDFILNKEKILPLYGVLFNLNMMLGTVGGDSYSFDEIEGWLIESGFNKISKIDLKGLSSALIEGFYT